MKSKKLAAVAAQSNEVQADLVLVPVFENGLGDGAAKRLQSGFGNSIAAQAEVESFSGKSAQTMMVFNGDKLAAKRSVYFGLGAKDKLDPRNLRTALAAAFAAAKRAKVQTVALAIPDLSGSAIDAAEFGRAAAESVVTVDYVINHFKTEKGGHKKEVHFKGLTLVSDSVDVGFQAGLKEGYVIGAAVNRARDLVNMPPNMMTPMKLAAQAVKIADASDGAIKCRLFKRGDLKKMGAFLAVSQGSDQPPVLIELVYEPKGADRSQFLTLIGKSVTYDSGGLDIKTGGSMRTMKCDMAGGATTLAVMEAVAALKLPVRLRVLMAATENMTGGSAYKSGDVLTSMSGMTIEVDNTDAEGRLTLADAIEYGKQQGATHIVDVATLTGAMVVALGKVATGAFSNDSALVGKVMHAAKAVGELVHEMPMFDEYAKANESNIADIKNSGGAGFGAGSITAAWFLRKFADKTPWVHLDVAGTAFNNNEATGWGVRTLVELVRDFATPHAEARVPGAAADRACAGE